VALGEHAAPRVTRGRVILLGSRGGGTTSTSGRGIWSGCEPSQEL
jgi:hypothetical protein